MLSNIITRMNKSSRYLWFWVLLQVCAVAGVFVWRMDDRPRFYYARIRATRADILGGLKVTLNMFANDCGRYPTTLEGFKALITCPTNISRERWQGPYFDPPKVPADTWGHDYMYRFPGVYNTNGFDLYSLGSDGISKSGGDDPDDINNWDPESPHEGTLLHSFVNDRLMYLKLISVLLIIPLFYVGLLIVGRFSPSVRESFAQNRAAYMVWRVTSLIVLMMFLSNILLPEISG